MSGFDTIVVVDWSAGKDTGARPRKDAIWAAVAASGGEAGEALYFRNRPSVEAWLADLVAGEIAAGRRVLAGFDFPFGYPAGFAEALTGQGDPLAVWEYYGEHLTDGARGNDRFALAARINRALPGVGPFWFNGERADHEGLPRKGTSRTPDHGLPERRHCEVRAKGAFTCWQMGGAGAVGGQVMTGMAALQRLRGRFPGEVAVWPFEPLDRPVALVEVWPSLIDAEVRRQTGPGDIRDAVQVRCLARALARMAGSGELAAMLADVPDAARGEEGWILGLGHEEALARAGRDMTDAKPMKNDCFALPPGVDWTPVDVALGALQASVEAVTGTERVPVAEAAGRILAAPAAAARSNPPGANAAVDGYGFAHGAVGSGPVRVPLAVGRAAAGAPFKGRVPEGSAIRILTGALIPEGVDTVVLEEDVTVEDGAVSFDNRLKPNANTRKAGEDVAAGDTAVPAGRRLTPADLALLTAVGVGDVVVRTRLRVGVLSTGDELSDPAPDAPASVTFDANRPMLLSLAGRLGFEAVDLGRAPDDRDALRAMLDDAASRCDVILTSGGASAGDEDHMSAIMAAEGQVAHWRIALKPGRPLALGRWRDVPVFGLPGNPVAALVCTLIFARPAMEVMAGGAWREPQGFTVPAAFTKRKKPGRREYLRARMNADGHAEVFASEGSGRISGLSWAEGLVEIEDGAREIGPGDPVRYIPYASFGL